MYKEAGFKDALINAKDAALRKYRQWRYSWGIPSLNQSYNNGYDYISNFYNNMYSQRFNTDWGENSTTRPKGMPKGFEGKPLCNMFLSYGGHLVNADNNPYINYSRGDSLSAQDIYNVLDNPEAMTKNGVFKGQVVPIDAETAMTIPGAIVARRHTRAGTDPSLKPQDSWHVAVTSGDGKTLSASSDMIRHNDWGFRPNEQDPNEYSYRYGLIVPEGVDVSTLLQDLKTKGIPLKGQNTAATQKVKPASIPAGVGIR
jgi:hypothetical protein